MPYSSVDEAKKANFPTTAEKIDLSLNQINKLAEIYDAVDAAGGTDNPMAVAWTRWKKLYKIENDKWVGVQGNSSISTSWIPVAKAGQVTTILNADGKKQKLTMTAEALENSENTWVNGSVSVNHKTTIPGLKILGAEYKDPFLYLEVSDGVEKLFADSDSTGRSIEVGNMVVDDDKIVSCEGRDISILYPPHVPACTPEMGCFSDTSAIFSCEGFNEAKSKKQPPSETVKEQNIIETISSKITELKEALTGVTHESIPDDAKEVIDMDGGLEEENARLRTQLATFEAKDEKATAEFEALTLEKTELEQKNADLAQKVAEFEKKEADELVKVRNAQFESILTKIPEGKKHTEEQKSELRAMFENDPYAFAAMIADFEKLPAQEANGAEFSADESEDGLAEVMELKKTTGW
ncbi:MAG: hypothetical protein SVK08_01035 [Halobacteriota archaeon]|nr:hypothetical protein [Halobacteriota archaeon]